MASGFVANKPALREAGPNFGYRRQRCAPPPNSSALALQYRNPIVTAAARRSAAGQICSTSRTNPPPSHPTRRRERNPDAGDAQPREPPLCRFVFALCSPGDEAALKTAVRLSQEARQPEQQLRPGFSRPGLVTWIASATHDDTVGGSAQLLAPTTAVRVTGPSLGRASCAEEVVGVLQEHAVAIATPSTALPLLVSTMQTAVAPTFPSPLSLPLPSLSE
jgi:hypothetical protein